MQGRRTAKSAGRRLTWVALGFLCTGLSAHAQFNKKNIIGDTPEPGTNNWLYPKGPDGNPFLRPSDPNFQDTQDLIDLGKILFWDEQLSFDNTMSCGTCHFPSAGGGDPRAGQVASNGHIGSIGMIPQDIDGNYGDGINPDFDRRETGVLAPPMIGAAFFRRLFWDLRAGPDFKETDGVTTIPMFGNFAALEDQAVGPPISPVEMAHDGMIWDNFEIQLKLALAKPLALATPSTIPADSALVLAGVNTYTDLFLSTFGAAGADITQTRKHIAMAIAHYERSLVPNEAPIDIPNGMSDQQLDGFDLINQSNCFGCHAASTTAFSGANAKLTLSSTRNIQDPFDQLLSDGRLHFINLPGPGGDDMVEDDVKTPTLRNLGLRTSFFHSGEMSSVTEIVEFYNRENGANPFFPFTSGSLAGGRLDPAEKVQVIDFLENALTDPRCVPTALFPRGEFPFDRPDLFSERVLFEQNEFFGSGTAGTGGLVPNIIANMPANIGNNEFRIGVGDAVPPPAGSTSPTGLVGLSFSAGVGPFNWLGPLIGGQLFPAEINDQGIGTFALPVPNDIALIGLPLFAQWAIVDPGAAGGFSASNPAAWVIF